MGSTVGVRKKVTSFDLGKKEREFKNGRQKIRKTRVTRI
jgi:hypothetical protein